MALLAGMLIGCAAVPDAPEKARELPVFPPPPEAPRFYYERTLYGSADIGEDEAGTLEKLVTGGERFTETLEKPYGVAAYKGRIYVGDTVKRNVSVFDLPARKYSRIGEDEPGALRLPLGLDVDGAGNLYVADGSTKFVQVYDPAGKHLRQLGGPDWFSRPAGLAVDSAGTRLYVVDIGGVDSANHRVRVFDARTGAHLFDFGQRGEQPGEFNLPRDIAVAPDGQLYVVDGGNFRVQVFDRDGKFLRVFGSVGRMSGQFSRPKEIGIDPSGNIYVVDAAFGNFQIFNPEGQLLLDVGGRSTTDAPAKYMLPSGIAIDGDGRVYMVDQFFRKVDVYRPARLAPSAGYRLGSGANPTADAKGASRPSAPTAAPR